MFTAAILARFIQRGVRVLGKAVTVTGDVHGQRLSVLSWAKKLTQGL